jgi:acetyl-CoA acetyltransferase
LRSQPVRILGGSEALCHTSMGRRDLTDMAAGQSGPRAMAMAGVKHADVDMCMIYDSFTITVLETLENLGFCKKGEGGAFVQNGRIGLGGDLPVNTDGGGLSSNHPGMRGIFLVIEAVKQLRGACGERQVKDCQVALCHGTGGMLGLRHSGVTVLLGKE